MDDKALFVSSLSLTALVLSAVTVTVYSLAHHDNSAQASALPGTVADFVRTTVLVPLTAPGLKASIEVVLLPTPGAISTLAVDAPAAAPPALAILRLTVPVNEQTVVQSFPLHVVDAERPILAARAVV